jgi:hypothetical protein
VSGSYLVNPVTLLRFPEQAISDGAEAISPGALARVSTEDGPVSVPAPSPAADGSCFGVVDVDGAASVNPITVLGNGMLIDGQASVTLAQDFGEAVFVADAGQWRRIVPARSFGGAQQIPIARVADISDPAAINIQGTFASRPSPGVPGRIFVATDSPLVFYDTGTSWRAYSVAQPFVTPPLAAAYTLRRTAINSTLVDDGGSLLFSATQRVATNDRQLATLALPATGTAYTLTVAMQLQAQGNGSALTSYSCAGICLARAATNASNFLFVYSDSGAYLWQKGSGANLTAAASVNFSQSAAATLAAGGLVWMRVRDNGGALAPTNLTWSYSLDGFNFWPLWTEQRDGIGVPDCAGLYVDPFNAPAAARYYSVSLTTP